MGMPTLVGKNKIACFAYIKKRLWKRLQSWKGKLLSATGKEILVQAVAQAIPTYVMNCFLLPKYFCASLNRLVASFWWNNCKGRKRIHWYFWDKICLPKYDGGLDFKNLYAFISVYLLNRDGGLFWIHNPWWLEFSKQSTSPTLIFLMQWLPRTLRTTGKVCTLLLRLSIWVQDGKWDAVNLSTFGRIPRSLSCPPSGSSLQNL